MFALESIHPETGCRVAIHDDDRVGYAYLLDPNGAIIGDVWLYNRQAPAAEIDFRGPAPFLNPFTAQRRLVKPVVAGDFGVFWVMTDDLLCADIYVHGLRWARLSPGSQPGWHVFAHEGPLAMPWPDEADEPEVPPKAEET